MLLARPRTTVHQAPPPASSTTGVRRKGARMRSRSNTLLHWTGRSVGEVKRDGGPGCARVCKTARASGHLRQVPGSLQYQVVVDRLYRQRGRLRADSVGNHASVSERASECVLRIVGVSVGVYVYVYVYVCQLHDRHDSKQTHVISPRYKHGRTQAAGRFPHDISLLSATVLTGRRGVVINA